MYICDLARTNRYRRWVCRLFVLVYVLPIDKINHEISIKFSYLATQKADITYFAAQCQTLLHVTFASNLLTTGPQPFAISTQLYFAAL